MLGGFTALEQSLVFWFNTQQGALVPSSITIEEGRRIAMERLIDEIMEELRIPANVPVLHECRRLLRKKVPLHMRAYVAAALAYRFSAPGITGSGSSAGAAGKPVGSARASLPGKAQSGQKIGKDDSRKPLPAEPRKQDHQEVRKEPRTDSPRKPQKEAQKTEARQEVTRENRYQGEGVVLFVSAGRRQRFYAKVVLRTLIDSGKVQEDQIGDIRTMDNYSFINIAPEAEEAAIQILGSTEYRGRLLTVNKAKKKEDQDSPEQV
jgi:hypothetical protein